MRRGVFTLFHLRNPIAQVAARRKNSNLLIDVCFSGSEVLSNSAGSSEADSGCCENHRLYISSLQNPSDDSNSKANGFGSSKSKLNERRRDYSDSSKNSSHNGKLSHTRSNARNNSTTSSANEAKNKPKKIPTFDLNSSSFPPLPGSTSNEVLNSEDGDENSKASDDEEKSS